AKHKFIPIMTGEEKRRQLKEQYKKDLKLRKEFLEKAKKLRNMSNVNKALTEMTDGLTDDSDEWISKINQETALTEAKLEMALDEASETQQKLEDLAKEAEMEKFSASEMVKQMKRELGMEVEEEEAEEEAKAEAKEGEEAASTEEGTKSTEDTPEESDQGPKTMGDW
ncbi:MAG: hypothetical protein AAF388_25325, partial [Bacteroidota bacterium]